MLSKNKSKYIQSLHLKKKRDSEKVFLAEGKKTIDELVSGGYKFVFLAATSEKINLFDAINCEKVVATNEEINQASLQKTSQEVIAICKQREPNSDEINFSEELVLALDNIQDPGNLGTIIRLASWFGINHVVCAKGSVDCYNPKTLQATMGAIAHVNVHYTDLVGFIANAVQTNIPVFGTFLEGENIYSSTLTSNGIIVLGNEGRGISTELEQYITKKLFIPSFQKNKNRVESLNVAMATSIICSEFRRRC